MASVSKRSWTYKGEKKTAWVVRYSDGAGDRRMKTFDLKRDADAYRLKVEVEIEKGEHVAASKTITVRELTEHFLDHATHRQLEGRRMGAVWLARLRVICDLHINHYLGGRPVSGLTFAEVEQWTRDLAKDRNLAPKTLRMTIGVLKDMVEFGIKRGAAGKNVVREVQKDRGGAPTAVVRTFTNEQVLAILKDTAIRRPHVEERSAVRLNLFVNVAAFCGLRFGEIQGLTPASIDFDRRLILVRHSLTALDEHKGPKTRAGIRDVPMPEHVAALFRLWIEKFFRPNPRHLLFRTSGGTAMGHANFMKRAWYPLLQRLGLAKDEDLGGYRFHSLRHFAASFMIECGLPITDVAAILGMRRSI